MRRLAIYLALFLVLFVWRSHAAPAEDWQETVSYKMIGSHPLTLFVYENGAKNTGLRPAVTFFNGGGWQKSNPAQFARQASALARRGFVAFLVEYRTSENLQGTPMDGVEDAKSAICWVRAHSAEYHIDPQRIAAIGGSAGGHLALSSFVVTGDNDECAVSSRPNALVLCNPALDFSKPEKHETHFRWETVDPFKYYLGNLPPTLILQGDADTVTTLESAEKFIASATSQGSSSVRIKVYPGRGHGFFNSPRDYQPTLDDMVEFFQELGWITPLH